MPNFIEISCSTCNKKYRVDASNYLDKTISFGCKNCNSSINYYVDSKLLEFPSQEEKKAPASKIMDLKSKIKVPKIPKLGIPQKEKKAKPIPEAAPPDIPNHQFKMEAADNNEVSSAIPKPVMEKPLETHTPKIDVAPVRPAPANIQVESPATNTPPQPTPQPNIPVTPKPTHKSVPEEIEEPIQANDDGAMIHLPKPGMPFISNFVTPGIYRAGSFKRQDYSYIISEITSYKTTVSQPEIAPSPQADVTHQPETIPTQKDNLTEEILPPKEDSLKPPAAAPAIEPALSPEPPASDVKVNSVKMPTPGIDLSPPSADPLDEPILDLDKPPTVPPVLPVNDNTLRDSDFSETKPPAVPGAIDTQAASVDEFAIPKKEIPKHFNTPENVPTPVATQQIPSEPPQNITPEQPVIPQVQPVKPIPNTPEPPEAKEGIELPKPPPSVTMEAPPGLPKQKTDDNIEVESDIEDDNFGPSNFSLDI